jgi:uncharacterized caspase-like protein
MTPYSITSIGRICKLIQLASLAVVFFLIAIEQESLAVPSLSNVDPQDKTMHVAGFEDKWAIVIGIDHFKDPQWDFKFAASDAGAVHRYLIRDAHFAADHVVLLTNQDATKEKITAALNWCAKQAKSEDLVLIYYRTRGISLTGNKPSYSAVLATADTTPERPSELSFEMSKYLSLISELFPSKRIILLTDADLSSNIEESIMSYDFAAGERLNRHRIIEVHCSSRNTQLTWESSNLHGSIFTRELLKSLRQKSTRGNLDESERRVAKLLKVIVPKIRPFHEQQISSGSVSTIGQVESRIDSTPLHPRLIGN